MNIHLTEMKETNINKLDEIFNSFLYNNKDFITHDINNFNYMSVNEKRYHIVPFKHDKFIWHSNIILFKKCTIDEEKPLEYIYTIKLPNSNYVYSKQYLININDCSYLNENAINKLKKLIGFIFNFFPDDDILMNTYYNMIKSCLHIFVYSKKYKSELNIVFKDMIPYENADKSDNNTYTKQELLTLLNKDV